MRAARVEGPGGEVTATGEEWEAGNEDKGSSTPPAGPVGAPTISSTRVPPRYAYARAYVRDVCKSTALPLRFIRPAAAAAAVQTARASLLCDLPLKIPSKRLRQPFLRLTALIFCLSPRCRLFAFTREITGEQSSRGEPRARLRAICTLRLQIATGWISMDADCNVFRHAKVIFYICSCDTKPMITSKRFSETKSNSSKLYSAS